MADALANLAATLALGAKEDMTIPVCGRWVVTPPEEESVQKINAVSIYEVQKEDRCQLLIDYLRHEKLSNDVRHKTEIQRRAPRFLYYNYILYRRSFLGLWMRCLGKEEAQQVMEEAHSGVCVVHQSGPKLYDRIKRMGYCWPTMVHDCIDFAKRCDTCQFHANFIHQPPEPLHPIVASWPCEAWGLNVIRPLTPKFSASHIYILAAIDYFTKWAEAITLKEVKKENVVDIQTHIIY